MKNSQDKQNDPALIISNIHGVREFFEVLQTTKLSQTAVMQLRPGGRSSEELSVHEKSDQVLLLLEGELHGIVGNSTVTMRKGDSCIIPAGTPHRFENHSKNAAITFNVYAPPEYAPGEKG